MPARFAWIALLTPLARPGVAAETSTRTLAARWAFNGRRRGMRALVGMAVLAAATSASVVTVVKTFPGPGGPNPPTAGSTSADMMGGVSPRHLVGFTNGGFSVLSKADGREV